MDAEEFERTGADQGVGDGAGSDGAAVGLHREAHPAAGHHGLAVQEVGSDEGQDQHFDAGEHHDQRGHHDGHHRPGADGTPRSDGGGHAADGDAGSQRDSPFTAELEVLAGYVIHEGPVQKIGFHDGAQASENDRPGHAGSRGGLHAEFGAEDHDGDLDEQFGTAGVMQTFGNARERVADENTGDKRHNETRFRSQADRPVDTELGLRVGRSRDMGVRAEHVADFADEKDDRERLDEPSDIAAEQLDAERQDRRQSHIRAQQRNDTRDRSLVCAGGGREGLVHAGPHISADYPAQHVEMRQIQRGQKEDETTRQQGYLIFVQIGLCHSHILL